MLNMRRFAKGIDEPVWVDILNASRKKRDEWRATTAEDMRLEEQGAPGFDLEGRFVAELDGRPVGIVPANVDRFREESKGSIRLDVPAEFRGGGIEWQLLHRAIGPDPCSIMSAHTAGVDCLRQLSYHGCHRCHEINILAFLCAPSFPVQVIVCLRADLDNLR